METTLNYTTDISQFIHFVDFAKRQKERAELANAPKIDILQVTETEALLYVSFYAFANNTPLHHFFSLEVVQYLDNIKQDIELYMDILPRIAQGVVSEAEKEHYLLKKMHAIRSKKSNQLLASKI